MSKEWLRTTAWPVLISAVLAIVIAVGAIALVLAISSLLRRAGDTAPYRTAQIAALLVSQSPDSGYCDARIAANVVVVSCAGVPARAAHLAGVRTQANATLETALAPFLRNESGDQPAAAAAPSRQTGPKAREHAPSSPSAARLTCALYRVNPVATATTGADIPSAEDLALCKIGDVDDVAIPLLLSGHAALTPASSLSWLFLEKESRLPMYESAQRAAQQERVGLWWDWPAGDGANADAVAWRAARDAQLANDASVTSEMQAWIASLLVLGGAAAVFLYESSRNRKRDEVTRRRRLYWLRANANYIRKEFGNRQYDRARDDAETLRKWLRAQGASPALLGTWDSVISAIRKESDSFKDLMDQFLSEVSNEPLLDAAASDSERDTGFPG